MCFLPHIIVFLAVIQSPYAGPENTTQLLASHNYCFKTGITSSLQEGMNIHSVNFQSFHMITAHDFLFHRHSYCNLKNTTVWGFHYMMLCKLGIKDRIVVGLLACLNKHVHINVI